MKNNIDIKAFTVRLREYEEALGFYTVGELRKELEKYDNDAIVCLTVKDPDDKHGCFMGPMTRLRSDVRVVDGRKRVILDS